MRALPLPRVLKSGMCNTRGLKQLVGYRMMQASISEKLLIINCPLTSRSVCKYDTNYKADLSLSSKFICHVPKTISSSTENFYFYFLILKARAVQCIPNVTITTFTSRTLKINDWYSHGMPGNLQSLLLKKLAHYFYPVGSRLFDNDQ